MLATKTSIRVNVDTARNTDCAYQCLLLFLDFNVFPPTSKISSWTEPLIYDVRLQNGLLVELVARMLHCPWHLSSAAVATSSQPGSGSPWRDALSRCPDLLCWRLGTSVVQESWERGGKPQLLRANVPAAGWTTMDSAHTSRPSLQQSGA